MDLGQNRLGGEREVPLEREHLHPPALKPPFSGPYFALAPTGIRRLAVLKNSKREEDSPPLPLVAGGSPYFPHCGPRDPSLVSASQKCFTHPGTRLRQGGWRERKGCARLAELCRVSKLLAGSRFEGLIITAVTGAMRGRTRRRVVGPRDQV